MGRGEGQLSPTNGGNITPTGTARPTLRCLSSFHAAGHTLSLPLATGHDSPVCMDSSHTMSSPFI